MEREDEVLEELTSFVDSVTFEDLSEQTARTAERCFVDTVGVMYPGAAKSAGSKAARLAEHLGDGGDAEIVGSDHEASPTDAAFVNGTAAHGLDFDDSQGAIPGHPSGVIVPTILAASRLVDRTGEEALAAYATGYATEYYVGQALKPDHYNHGWHANGTLGTFGALGAAANYLDLDTAEIRHALNVTSSMPAGVRANFGTDTKPMHSGQAARSGLTAALLAAEGFTAGENALAGEQGFFQVYAGESGPNFDALPTPDTELLADVGVDIKKYACAHPQHGAMGAASQLVDEHEIDPASIESVHARVSEIADVACRYDDPGTGLEAKFSLPYTIAAAIALDRVTLQTFDDEGVQNPDVQAIRERVTYESDSSMPYRSFGATVSITTASGETFERTLEYPPGAHENPLSDEELYEKFTMCAQYADLDDPDEVYETLDSLREQSDMRDIAALV